MAINLLPRDYQKGLRRERARRFIVVCGFAVFLSIVANMILISPLWLLFTLQERELGRELEAIKKSPAFADVSDVENSIRNLNKAIISFNASEADRFEVAPAMESVIDRKPPGVSIDNISFLRGAGSPSKPHLVSVFGRAATREALLGFASANESNPFFSKVHSPITNLLKEFDFDYSLSFELAI